jgi:hypothetical protein
MWPFYFFIKIPEGTEDGLLILQRTGHFGIRKVLHWVLDSAFTEKYPDLKLRLSSLADEDQMEKYVQGRVQEITFVRKTISADVEDNYDRGHKEVQGSVELVIRARRGSALPMNSWLTQVFRSRKSTGIFAFEKSQKFAYENVKAKVKVGHASRTINAGNPLTLRPYHDITDTVKIGKNGHPNFDSIDRLARDLAAKFEAVLYKQG